MWIFVCIDMPSRTKHDRIYREDIVKSLTKEGFYAVNKSLFVRSCSTIVKARQFKARVLQVEYAKAGLSIIMVADQQINESYHYNGRSRKKNKEYYLNPSPDIEFL